MTAAVIQLHRRAAARTAAAVQLLPERWLFRQALSDKLIQVEYGMSENLRPSERSESAESSGRRNPAWLGGAVLIILGIVFLVRNLTGFSINNWWAIFILIPAVGSLATAWRIYQSNGGRFTPAARGPLIGGLILLTVASVFLFDLDWGAIWPVFLIIIGVGTLFTSLSR